jgi:excinuclease ABC subunit A
VIDRIKVARDGSITQRLAESFETALRHADGRAIAVEMGRRERHGEGASLLGELRLPRVQLLDPELEPRLFSFNNPMGACRGATAGGDHVLRPEARRRLSAPVPRGGAIRGGIAEPVLFAMLTSLAQHYAFDVDAPFESLPQRAQEVVLQRLGRGEDRRSAIPARRAAAP